MLGKKYFPLAISLIILIVLYGIHFSEFQYVQEFRIPYNSSLLKPLNALFLYLVPVTLVVAISNNVTYTKWLKYLMSWFLPAAIVLISLASPSPNVASLSRTDIAQLSGQILLALTVAFALFDTFYLQKRAGSEKDSAPID